MAITTSASTQKHYIEILADQLGMHSNILEAQYIDFRKKNKFITNKHQVQQEQIKTYQPDRELLFASLLHQNFYEKFIENREIRQKFVSLIELIVTNLGIDHRLNIILHDPAKEIAISELQLRREKETEERQSEEDRLGFIKQTILHTIHQYYKDISKDKKIDHDKKLQILKAMREAKM